MHPRRLGNRDYSATFMDNAWFEQWLEWIMDRIGCMLRHASRLHGRAGNRNGVPPVAAPLIAGHPHADSL